jgi:hypothetical protein
MTAPQNAFADLTEMAQRGQAAATDMVQAWTSTVSAVGDAAGTQASSLRRLTDGLFDLPDRQRPGLGRDARLLPEADRHRHGRTRERRPHDLVDALTHAFVAAQDARDGPSSAACGASSASAASSRRRARIRVSGSGSYAEPCRASRFTISRSRASSGSAIPCGPPSTAVANRSAASSGLVGVSSAFTGSLPLVSP